MKSLAEARIKRAHALKLVSEGKSYDEIADAVGYRQRGSAHRAVFKALAEREEEAVDNLRALEGARLDHLQLALWDKAMDGDPRAVDSVLRIIQERSRLMGLYEHGADGRHQGPTQLVARPVEGNPGRATSCAASWYR